MISVAATRDDFVVDTEFTALDKKCEVFSNRCPILHSHGCPCTDYSIFNPPILTALGANDVWRYVS